MKLKKKMIERKERKKKSRREKEGEGEERNKYKTNKQKGEKQILNKKQKQKQQLQLISIFEYYLNAKLRRTKLRCSGNDITVRQICSKTLFGSRRTGYAILDEILSIIFRKNIWMEYSAK